MASATNTCVRKIDDLERVCAKDDYLWKRIDVGF
jgi:hypothetical protein